jgi:hypothetical protein
MCLQRHVLRHMEAQPNGGSLNQQADSVRKQALAGTALFSFTLIRLSVFRPNFSGAFAAAPGRTGRGTIRRHSPGMFSTDWR